MFFQAREIYLGLCLPKSCTNEDVSKMLIKEPGQIFLVNIINVRTVPGSYQLLQDPKFQIIRFVCFVYVETKVNYANITRILSNICILAPFTYLNSICFVRLIVTSKCNWNLQDTHLSTQEIIWLDCFICFNWKFHFFV